LEKTDVLGIYTGGGGDDDDDDDDDDRSIRDVEGDGAALWTSYCILINSQLLCLWLLIFAFS
jgi:hypothetical protein